MYLIIGASGFIGRHLFNYCMESNIEVMGTYYSHCYNSQLIPFNICMDNLEDMCVKKLNGVVPDAVIICSAISSIDECKRDEKASNDLNVLGMKRIIRQAGKMGIKCVFLSSEAVFDGRCGMYTEEDVPNPINLYGRQKLEIEQYITQNFDKYLILRISRAVGSRLDEDDIFREFYNKINCQKEIICLKNQSFCITEIGDIVQGILKALEQDVTGLYHLSSANYISRYKLAQMYAESMFGGYDRIVEMEYSEIPFLDNRHIYGGLDGRRLSALLRICYWSTEEILDRYVDSYKEKGAI